MCHYSEKIISHDSVPSERGSSVNLITSPDLRYSSFLEVVLHSDSRETLNCFLFDCPSLTQEEPGKVIVRCHNWLFGTALLSGLGTAKMVVWELIWDSRRGGRSEGDIGVGATVNEEEGVWLSLRSANLDSGRNFMWFIQELLHLYKLTPAKI